MLDHAKWIWNCENFIDDEYAEFVADFSLLNTQGVNLEISVDGSFAALVNGTLAYFNECSDDEDNKLYDRYSLDKFVKLGENKIYIIVWHHGKRCSIYKRAKAGLIFSIIQNDKEIYSSSENTLSRKNVNYENGRCKYITPQLGLGYRYDNTFENDAPYTKSALIDKSKDFTLRDIESLVLEDRIETELKIENNLVTVDMLKETVGFLELDLFSESEQNLIITFGEHLNEKGLVSRFIGIRDFSVEFNAKKGENKFIAPLRRLAGRYIQFEVKSPVTVRYAALRPVNYPVKTIERKFTNKLHNDIYSVCAHTLRCCMHAHYEDCPWREQALYAMDSKNQMLAGYIAFKEYRFAKHNLLLLKKSYLKDLSLLNITYPRDSRLPIPLFSLVYPVQVYEYVAHSGDYAIIEQVKDVLDGIMQGFKDRIGENGLIANFGYPCWNFYEWTEGNDNETDMAIKEGDIVEEKYDLILNAAFIYAYSYYDKLTGNKTDLSKTVKAIKDTFYNAERALFISSTKNGNYSVLANAFAILCGAADKDIADKIVNQRGELIDSTLSMNGFLYEALISCDNKYKDYVVKDIEEKYGYMLSQGATTFWETINGSKDFLGAGSLCHGWSALPIYWLDKLVGKEK